MIMFSVPVKQTALVLEGKCGALVLNKGFTVPRPGRNEVLVRIHSTALNTIDWKIQRYGLYIRDYPTVLGGDIAGDVVGLGEGVQSEST